MIEDAARARDEFAQRTAIFVVWAFVAGALAVQHVVWRDEVRALSFALSGDTFVDMLRNLRGEGHPALWYILLRAGHLILPHPQILGAVSALIAAATAALICFRSPFPPLLIALILLGDTFLFEYTVVARNYGLVAYFLFALAALYRSGSTKGWAYGLLIFLMVNSQTLGAVLAGGFFVIWFVDLVLEERFRATPRRRAFFVTVAFAAVGLGLSFATVYPPVNDAVSYEADDFPERRTASAILFTALFPATQFQYLIGGGDLAFLLSGATAGTLLLLGSYLFHAAAAPLWRRPGAALGFYAVLLALTAFFRLVYKAYPRHEAFLLCFLLAAYWIRWERTVEASPPGAVFGRKPQVVLRQIGIWGLSGILVLCAVQGVGDVKRAIDGPPFSRSAEFAELVKSRDDLKNAIIMGDPEFMLDALPYYLDNPIYMIRLREFRPYTAFAKRMRESLSPADLVKEGRELMASTGRPVIILLGHDVDHHGAHDLVHSYSRYWTMRGTAEALRRFFDETTPLKRFGDAVSHETYEAFLLKPAPAERL